MGEHISKGQRAVDYYSFRGQMFRESAHNNDEVKARKLLK
jgi:hypothetical protein